VGLVLVATDGYVGEDGRAAAWAFVVSGARQAREAGALPGGPSHLAEWTAVSRALAWAEARLDAGDELELRTDSALVAKGLASRRPEMSGEAAELRAACRQALARLAGRGVRARVVRVRREENEEADAEARRAARRGASVLDGSRQTTDDAGQ
jgi:ribonuclease HI